MGLDMYLNTKKYLYSGEWNKDTQEYEDAMEIQKIIGSKKRVKEITCEGMYWRKANQIHAWFVNNIQEGEDDCKEYYVSRDQLLELLSLCNRVIADPEKAAELLPSQSGFFFGNTDYDQYYFDDIHRTAEGIKDVLDNFGSGWDFYYQSSW